MQADSTNNNSFSANSPTATGPEGTGQLQLTAKRGFLQPSDKINGHLNIKLPETQKESAAAFFRSFLESASQFRAELNSAIIRSSDGSVRYELENIRGRSAASVPSSSTGKKQAAELSRRSEEELLFTSGYSLPDLSEDENQEESEAKDSVDSLSFGLYTKFLAFRPGKKAIHGLRVHDSRVPSSEINKTGEFDFSVASLLSRLPDQIEEFRFGVEQFSPSGIKFFRDFIPPSVGSHFYLESDSHSLDIRFEYERKAPANSSLQQSVQAKLSCPELEAELLQATASALAKHELYSDFIGEIRHKLDTL